MRVQTTKESSFKTLCIGTSGYYFDDWIGTAYPPKTKKSSMFDEYLKLGFDSLELNFTYYRLAGREQLRNFSLKADKDFSFIIKAYKGITHEKAERETVKTVSENYLEGNVNGNFRGILLQFPESFHKTNENIEYLIMLREEMKEINLFVEFRRSDWMSKETSDLLSRDKMNFVSADLPKIENLPEMNLNAASESSYLRLHGRNKEWYTAEDRYDYLYSDAEITQFQKDVLFLMNKTNTTFVFFNNCHGGFAVKNALLLKDKLIKEMKIEAK